MDNYQLQAQQAKKLFLSYDQEALIQKLSLKYDDFFLYTSLLSQPYRLHRQTGDLQKLEKGQWCSADSHGEVMTLLDLICDSRADRRASLRWASVQTLGRMFHRELAEQADPLAAYIDAHPEAFRTACRCLGGKPMDGGDMGYLLPFFDTLSVGLQFWHSDEDFPAKLHVLWDENTLQFMRYETVWYALGLLRRRLREEMHPS